MKTIQINDPQYIIIKKNKDNVVFYNGADLYGRDVNHILRMKNIKWSEALNLALAHAFSLERAKEILIGIESYEEKKEDISYHIVKLQLCVQITNLK